MKDKNECTSCFICFSNSSGLGGSLAEKVKKSLNNRCDEVFFSSDENRSYCSNYREEEIAALERADFFILILTKDFVKRLKKESETAFELQKAFELRIRIVPVAADEFEWSKRNIAKFAKVLTREKAMELRNTDYIPYHSSREYQMTENLLLNALGYIGMDSFSPKSVYFGRYFQLAGSTEKSPIEWFVLKQEPKRQLLISKYVLDAQPYNKKLLQCNWCNCTLREWLNVVFYNEAFTEDEKQRILEVTNTNESEFTKSLPCPDTLDKVFLLSKKEAKELFGSADRNRKSKATSYANSRGVDIYNEGDASWWWLRSLSYNPLSASGVLSTGEIDPMNQVDFLNRGVRPAIWVKCEF